MHSRIGSVSPSRATRHERVDEQRARHPDEVAGAVGERALADLGTVDAPLGEHRESGAARLARAANGTPWPGAKSIGGTIRYGCS